MSDWRAGQLADSIAALDAGVSVNAEDRPHGAGEIGVLKTSSVSGGRFIPEQNKTVFDVERRLVAEPVHGDSILVSRMNTPALVGEYCYVREPHPTLFLPDRLWQLKPKGTGQVSMRWLSYVLQSGAYRRYVEVHATGTSGTMKNLPKSKLLSLPVRYPPEEEQIRIAQILDTLDTAIQETEAIIAKLKAVKQGLLHDLLTRGIDDNGELRPRQAEAPQLYKASPFGWIPDAWNICGVLDVAPNDRQAILTGPFGADLGQADFRSDGVPVLRIGNVQAGFIDWHDTQFVAQSKAATLEKYRVHEGDLLFARQGATTGRNALADARADGALINYHIIRVATDQAKCHPEYMYATFNSAVAKARVDQDKGHGTREGINSAQIAALRFPLPPADEQAEAVRRMKCIDERIQSELTSVAKLQLQRTGLMDDLLTGHVRVTPLLALAAA